MALLLLVSAGLFIRSLQKAASIDSGFNVRNVDTLQIDTHLGGYRADAEGLGAVEALLERFGSMPGVTGVAASRIVPLQGGGMGLGPLHVPGRVGQDGRDGIDADWDVVSPGYFSTLELRIVQGRRSPARIALPLRASPSSTNGWRRTPGRARTRSASA